MFQSVISAKAAKSPEFSTLSWERFDHLLRCPLGGRMLGHVAVENTSALMGQDHEHEEHAACDGWHREEIERD